MLLENIEGFDFHMKYFNSDGLEGSMCGNGGRCMIHFARELGLFERSVRFTGIDGPHEGRIDSEGTVHLKMQDVTGIARDGDAWIIDTGSPHYIVFTENLYEIDVTLKGREIRYRHEYGEKGINVNFVEEIGNALNIRTYERGVERETLACGTGSVAAAIAHATRLKNKMSQVIVRTRGGTLKVSFKQSGYSLFTDIWLSGPAEKVFSGLTGMRESGLEG
jgi:diaminopimelate epimerase